MACKHYGGLSLSSEKAYHSTGWKHIQESQVLRVRLCMSVLPLHRATQCVDNAILEHPQTPFSGMAVQICGHTFVTLRSTSFPWEIFVKDISMYDSDEI